MKGDVLTVENLGWPLEGDFFLLDKEGFIRYVSPSVARILGREEEELLDRKPDFLFPPGGEEHPFTIGAISEGRNTEALLRLENKRGTVSFLKVRLSPLRTGEGIAGAVGTVADVTDEVESERILERKALFLRLYMEILSGLQKVERFTEVLHLLAGKAAEAMGADAGCMAAVYRSERGWLARQLVSVGWFAMEKMIVPWRESPARDVETFLQLKEAAVLEEDEGPREWIDSSGYACVLAMPVFTAPQGAFVVLVAMRERAGDLDLEKEFLEGLRIIGELAFRQSQLLERAQRWEDRYLDLLDGLDEAVLVCKGERVVFANRSLSLLLGYSGPRGLVGRHLGEVLSPQSLEDVRLLVKGSVGSPVGIRVEAVGREGKRMPLQGELAPLPLLGQKAYQVVLRECGPGKDLQPPKREAEVDRDFLSRLSHDLRTPVQCVSGFTHYLEKVMADHPRDDVREALEGLRRGTARLARLLDHLLSLAGGGSSLLEGESDSGEAVREVLDEYAREIEEMGVQVEVEGEMPKVALPEAELLEIFQNLVSNALRAVKGMVRPRLVVRYGREGDFHHFIVEDNGVGIPQEYQKDVFLPLFRLVPGEEGSGLGLSIVRRIIKSRGGDIWLESQPGRGTKVHFTVPA
jgi:PAS domain S-box-containing protein